MTDAIEQADLEALVGLLVADARLSMPPAMLEYRGVDVARRLFTAATFRPGRSYRVVPTRANGQPALGMYTADPHTGVYRGYSLLVVTIVGDRITVVAGFDASVMPRFGLPRTLPDTDWTTDSSGGCRANRGGSRSVVRVAQGRLLEQKPGRENEP